MHAIFRFNCLINSVSFLLGFNTRDIFSFCEFLKVCDILSNAQETTGDQNSSCNGETKKFFMIKMGGPC